MNSSINVELQPTDLGSNYTTLPSFGNSPFQSVNKFLIPYSELILEKVVGKILIFNFFFKI